MTFLRSCALSAALSIACGSASASALFSHTDIYDAGDIALGSSATGNEVTWTFNILDDGYTPATESIVSAIISITLSDYNNTSYNAEAELSVAGVDLIEWNFFVGTQSVALTAFTTLSNTGKLEVTLEADDGIFYFNEARLQAHDVSTVPVPAAIWLFGSGLLGLAGVARARKKA